MSLFENLSTRELAVTMFLNFFLDLYKESEANHVRYVAQDQAQIIGSIRFEKLETHQCMRGYNLYIQV